MDNFTFYAPTYFDFGKGAEAHVSQLIRRFGGTKVLLHYGGGSIKRSGLYDRVTKCLKDEKIDFQIIATLYLFKDADKDSVIATIEKKLSEYKTTLSAKLGKSVVQTQIIAILNSVYGVFKVELKTPNDIDISESQWANLTNWNISIGGYANE